MVTRARRHSLGLGVACLALLALSAVGPARAEVRRVVVTGRQGVLDGAYERLTGSVELELDPAHPANAAIVDLDHAPRNARGRVEASADFMVLRPRHRPARGSTALLEVSNRGGKAVLPYFDGAAWSVNPTTDEDFGDRLLIRLGLTIIWVGWQFDVPHEPGLLRLQAPVATEGGRRIEGLVRSDWTIDQPATRVPLGLRARGWRGRHPRPDPHLSQRRLPARQDLRARLSCAGSGRGRPGPRRRPGLPVVGALRSALRVPGHKGDRRRHLAERTVPAALRLPGLQHRRERPEGLRRDAGAHRGRRARELQPPLCPALPRRPSVLGVLLPDRSLPVHRPRPDRPGDGGGGRALGALPRPAWPPAAGLLHEHRLRVLGTGGLAHPHLGGRPG